MQVQDDIVASLRLRNPLRLVSSFDRPNIDFSVRFLKTLESPLPIIAKELTRDGAEAPCAIVYTLKRESADETAFRLRNMGTSLPPSLEALNLS